MGVEPSAGQTLMIGEGAPSAIVTLTPEERRQAWATRPSAARPAKEQTMRTETAKTSKADQVASLRVARATRKAPPAPPASTAPAKTKPPKAAAKAKKVAPAPKPAKSGVRPGSKLEIVVGLLTRKQGCTAKDCMDACNWPSISMQQQARAAGLTLRTEKEGRTTRYWAD